MNIPLSNWKGTSTESPSQAEFVMLEVQEVNKLIGQVLTVVDATYGDATQRNAVKQLLKNEVWKWASKSHLAITQEGLMEISKTAVEIDVDLEDPRDL